MKIKSKKTFYWEFACFIFVVGFGSILHFTYSWSQNSPIVGMMSSVNESVWEHMKLGFWSLAIFSVIEYLFVKKDVTNFLVARAVGLFTMQLFIIIFFYTYTAVVGEEILIVDILSYIVGAAFCQLISYKILIAEKIKSGLQKTGIVFLSLHLILLIVFTFSPPKLPIFADPHEGTYGVDWNEEYRGNHDHE